MVPKYIFNTYLYLLKHDYTVKETLNDLKSWAYCASWPQAREVVEFLEEYGVE